MSREKLAIALAAGLVAAYLVAGPYITVHKMKTAAEAHDGSALSKHIEFPSVRQGLKDQMNATLAKTMMASEDTRDKPLAVLGATLAGVVVDKMVDAYVTPAGITQLMAGQEPGPRKHEESDTSSRSKPFSDASMSYQSWNRFVVTVRTEDGGQGQFVLRRRGLGWKLTDVLLPLD